MATSAMNAFLASQTIEQLNELSNVIAELMENRRVLGIARPFKQAKSKAAGRPAKRPLNSFMAFRAYYSPAFKNVQQKSISGFVNRIWSGDLAKAKWAIVAKAYSNIRDRVGKEKAPLDAFLAISCPAMGILPPETYFEKMGWSISGAGCEPTRLFEAEAASFDLTTYFSVEDLVIYCENLGYANPIPGKSTLARH
jgi:Mating-type protein MAT alpha 1 HMG-box